MQYNNKNITFQPTLVGWLVTLICIPLFINFGLWQYGKAQKQKVRQQAYEQTGKVSAKVFPESLTLSSKKVREKWQYKKVKVSGEYQVEDQVLLDNKVHQTRAGYHVMTPLKITGSNQSVLINRGWIPANADHSNVPVVKTPEGLQTIVGQAWIPSERYFTLEDKSTAPLQKKSVWQYLDLNAYQKTVALSISPIVIKMDPASKAGGFVRQWQVSFKRIATHMSYAYQWFGFAAATLFIFIYMSVNIKNVADEEK